MTALAGVHFLVGVVVLVGWSILLVATWIALVCLALVLAVGLSWAHVWRRLTGQYSVDELDD